MLNFLKTFSIFLLITFFANITSANSQENNTKVTIGVPLYVYHPDDRPGSRDWNDGWFENEGVFADVSWPVYSFGASTDLRLGATAGVFDNSIFDTSVFVGGMAEIETHATDRVFFNAGTYAGLITGYDMAVGPAMAPYAGAGYHLTDKVEIGLRGVWLPAKTIAGSEDAPSDAYVGTVTIGTRF